MSIRTQQNSRRFIATAAAVAIAASSFIATSSPVSATQSPAESRVGGLDRYATAAQVATATFPAGSTRDIILASGENFPDGHAAAGLSGAVGAPILLTRKDELPATTANALAAVFPGTAPRTVHILGGVDAVSAAVANQVAALGYTVNRIEGADRYSTAAAIAALQVTIQPVGLTVVNSVPLRTAILVTGENFPDALSSGAPANAGRHPVLLTRTGSLPPATADALANLRIQRVIIVGGEAAVSPAVAAAVTGLGIAVTRVGGADRGATAALLANALVATPAAGGFDF